jgi:hypothetical protein
MWVSRFIDRLGLWAIVEVGPCPWCSKTARHRHQILDEGAEVDKEPVDVPAFA